MSLLAELKLKSTTLRKTCSKQSGAAEPPGDAVARELELNQRLRHCDLEAWYPALADVTFPAVFLPISQVEARAMMARYAHQQGLPPDAAASTTPFSAADSSANAATAAAAGTAPAVGAEEAVDDVLVKLAARIEDAGHQLRATGGDVAGGGATARVGADARQFPDVFVKLSSRSPKDAAGCQARAHTIAAGRLRDWAAKNRGGKGAGEGGAEGSVERGGAEGTAVRMPDGNVLADAIFHGSIQCLKASTPAEVSPANHDWPAIWQCCTGGGAHLSTCWRWLVH